MKALASSLAGLIYRWGNGGPQNRGGAEYELTAPALPVRLSHCNPPLPWRPLGPDPSTSGWGSGVLRDRLVL